MRLYDRRYLLCVFHTEMPVRMYDILFPFSWIMSNYTATHDTASIGKHKQNTMYIDIIVKSVNSSLTSSWQLAIMTINDTGDSGND